MPNNKAKDRRPAAPYKPPRQPASSAAAAAATSISLLMETDPPELTITDFPNGDQKSQDISPPRHAAPSSASAAAAAGAGASQSSVVVVNPAPPASSTNSQPALNREPPPPASQNQDGASAANPKSNPPSNSTNLPASITKEVDRIARDFYRQLVKEAGLKSAIKSLEESVSKGRPAKSLKPKISVSLPAEAKAVKDGINKMWNDTAVQSTKALLDARQAELKALQAKIPTDLKTGLQQIIDQRKEVSSHLLQHRPSAAASDISDAQISAHFDSEIRATTERFVVQQTQTRSRRKERTLDVDKQKVAALSDQEKSINALVEKRLKEKLPKEISKAIAAAKQQAKNQIQSVKPLGQGKGKSNPNPTAQQSLNDQSASNDQSRSLNSNRSNRSQPHSKSRNRNSRGRGRGRGQAQARSKPNRSKSKSKSPREKRTEHDSDKRRSKSKTRPGANRDN